MKYISKLTVVFLFSIIFSLSFSNNDFYLGIQDHSEPNIKINNKSLNDIIVEIFKDGLGLNVIEVKSTWSGSYNMLENRQIYALGLVTKDDKGSLDIVYTNQIFSENLYLVSSTVNLTSPHNLENKNIYTLKDNQLIKSYLIEYLEDSKVNAHIIEVDSLDKYSKEIYLDSEFTALPIKNKLFIRHLPPVCIGVRKEYRGLIPLINKLLEEKYSEEISNYIKQLHLYYQRKSFREKLTPDEINWLKNKKKIITAYEDDITLSIFSEYQNKFIGILPIFSQKISSIIDIPIVYKTNKKYNWNSLHRLLLKDKIDFLAISASEENSKDLIFSEAVDSMPMYLINHNNSKNYSIGVLKNGKSDHISKKYFPSSNIIRYNSTLELFQAFREDKVGYVIAPNLAAEITCNLMHTNIKIKDIDINYGFQKDDIILQHIFNKAISEIGHYEKEQLFLKADQIQKNYLLNSIHKNYRYNKVLLIGFMILIFLLIILISKMSLNNKISKLLKIDQLTGLYNRFVFTSLCDNTLLTKGTVAVIDLDNFKRANDNYGHDVGDLILIEVGKILLKSFGKESSFRISGDEFYIFEKNNDFLKTLTTFITLCEDSDLLKKYDITISLGYYNKDANEETKEAFKKADLAMYQSKKIIGFSSTEYNSKIN